MEAALSGRGVVPTLEPYPWPWVTEVGCDGRRGVPGLEMSDVVALNGTDMAPLWRASRSPTETPARRLFAGGLE